MIIDGMDAKQSQSGLKLSDRSELQAREDRERKDRAGWYSDGHNNIRDGSKGILVAACLRKGDADLILTMARSYDAMREALEVVTADFVSAPCTMGEAYGILYREFERRARIAADALSLANGSKKEVVG